MPFDSAAAVSFSTRGREGWPGDRRTNDATTLTQAPRAYPCPAPVHRGYCSQRERVGSDNPASVAGCATQSAALMAG